MADQIFTKFGEQIWVAKQSSWMVQNFCTVYAVGSWKSCYNKLRGDLIISRTANLLTIITVDQ